MYKPKLFHRVSDKRTGRSGVVIGGGERAAFVQDDNGVRFCIPYAQLKREPAGAPHVCEVCRVRLTRCAMCRECRDRIKERRA